MSKRLTSETFRLLHPSDSSPSPTFSEAIHEAGHATVAFLRGMTLSLVTIEANPWEGTVGATWAEAGLVTLGAPARPRRRTLLDALTVLYAGVAAERCYYGATATGDDWDETCAERLRPGPRSPSGAKQDAQADRSWRRLQCSARWRARRDVRLHLDVIRELADVLWDNGPLSGAKAEMFLAGRLAHVQRPGPEEAAKVSSGVAPLVQAVGASMPGGPAERTPLSAGAAAPGPLAGSRHALLALLRMHPGNAAHP